MLFCLIFLATYLKFPSRRCRFSVNPGRWISGALERAPWQNGWIYKALVGFQWKRNKRAIITSNIRRIRNRLSTTEFKAHFHCFILWWKFAVVQTYHDFFTALEMLLLSAFGEIDTPTLFFIIWVLQRVIFMRRSSRFLISRMIYEAWSTVFCFATQWLGQQCSVMGRN